ncbi:hypothetical protein [Aneurinibacillus aneurinilyticus]|uniref:hypothetical protein n=1 Tax=Aneurinibacillus aneurinilyticus TaxID=1391 RepID=UPI0023F0B1FD|nr:hypothetical protein [Aneurinibacillus aneurinilyticus]
MDSATKVIQERKRAPKNIVQSVWFGQFNRGIADRDAFSRMVDYLITLSPTMSERVTAAEGLYAYYTEVTGDVPKETDRRRLFDWIREEYRPDDYPIYTDFELSRMVSKYEKPVSDMEYDPQHFSTVKRKGGMVEFKVDSAHENPETHRVDYVRL